MRSFMFFIDSLAVLREPSIISLEATSIVKVLLLLPAVVGVYFIGPWLTLSLLVRILLRIICLFIVDKMTWLVESVKITIAVRKAFELSLLFLLLELCFVILFVIDLDEAGQPLIWCDTSLPFKDVDHDAIGSLLDSLKGEAGFLSQPSLIADICFIREVIDTMKELASLTIHAVTLLLVLGAHLGLVVWWQVLFRHELIHVVCIWAGVSVLAIMIHQDVPAHFSLLHLLDFLVELEALLLVDELLLLGRPGGLTKALQVVEVIVLVGLECWLHLLEVERPVDHTIWCGLVVD